MTVYTAAGGNDPQLAINGFGVERLATLLRVGNAALLPGLLRLPSYDIVHLHYPFIMGAELIWLNRHFRHQPYVLTYHNELRWHGIRGLFYALYQRTCGKGVLKGAECIILTSADFGRASTILLPLHQAGRPRIVEIPNGVDIERFNPKVDAQKIRKEHCLDDGHVVVLFAGAMDPAHHLKGGVAELLHAIADMREQRVIGMFVGGGTMLETYKALAQSLALTEQVRFVGWVTHENMAQYYAAADIVVQPSVLMEAFGMVAIEAMACGRPVIVSNLPGVRSVVRDGEDGLLVRPGDVTDLVQKMHTLVDDPALRRTMGEKGRAKVEHRYTWEKIIPQLAHVYKQVLGVC